MSAITIGVDVGNYDTKTQHSLSVSGYKKYKEKPQLSDNVLFYKDSYYVPDIAERLPYETDKTINDQCLILTLFGIAKELLYIAKNDTKSDSIQTKIDTYKHIKLGIGLPPGHIIKLKEKTLIFYRAKLSGVVSFTYNNYYFNFELDDIRLFPQDFTAVYRNKNCNTIRMKRYYIVGIGGGTTDVIPVIDGKPDVNNCLSLIMGTRIMYKHIMANIQRQYGEMLDESLVEDVLRNEETMLPTEIVELIKEGASNHLNHTVNECIQNGYLLNLYPVVFFGGGCLLLKDEILANEHIKNAEFIEDIHANAKAYAECM